MKAVNASIARMGYLTSLAPWRQKRLGVRFPFLVALIGDCGGAAILSTEWLFFHGNGRILGAFLAVLADIVPMAIALAGVIISYQSPKEQNRLKVTFILVLSGFLEIGILSWVRINNEASHKAEMNQLTQKLDKVGEQNTKLGNILIASRETGKISEADRRKGIENVLRNEYILSHDPIDPQVLAGNKMPPEQWMNERLKEMNENWHFSALDQLNVGSPGGPSTFRIGTGPDAYKDIPDDQFGQLVIEEANRIDNLARNFFDQEEKARNNEPFARSIEALRLNFPDDYDECCADAVKQLHEELIRRITPANRDVEEQRRWRSLSTTSSTYNQLLPVTVEEYSTYFRLLGVRIRQKGHPRPGGASLSFETSYTPNPTARPGGFPVEATVTLKNRSPVGYAWIIVGYEGTRSASCRASEGTEDWRLDINMMPLEVKQYVQAHPKVCVIGFDKKPLLSDSLAIWFGSEDHFQITSIRAFNL